MKHIFKTLPGLVVLMFLASCSAPQSTETKIPESADYNFIVANDLGRNGFYDQKPIAAAMGAIAEEVDVEFIAAAGDVHHFEGVASTTDPLWMTNFELIYDHPELMLNWYAILGNHEYRGNTQACLDYSNVSRRWIMPDRYYTLLKEVDDSTSLRLLFIDTTPLIDKYREESDTYPDAVKQDKKKQLQFIDSVLATNKSTWTVVIGHHPVYAFTPKDKSERDDMQRDIDPLLRKYKVDFYINGHIHNFQHIKMEGSPVDYITNSSASLSRKVEKTTGTQFCSDQSGFMLCGVKHSKFIINFLDKNGNAIYTYSKKK